MSTSLVVLASVLAFFALVLIPFMLVRTDKQQNRVQQQVRGKNVHHKKKRR